jgi:hypothetical protein
VTEHDGTPGPAELAEKPVRPGMTGPRLAVLIDAENATYRVIGSVMEQVRAQGRPCVVRAYGNWMGSALGGWAKAIETHSILPVHQSRHVGHKNASDVALVVDAMDLLHSGLVDGFCLVSSDSDFTRLAQRIREQGLWLMVCGRRETPQSLVSACDQFVAFEDLDPPPERETPSPPAETKSSPNPQKKKAAAAPVANPGGEKPAAVKATPPPVPAEMAELLLVEWQAALEKVKQGSTTSDSVPIGTLGARIHDRLPGFDPRSFGYRQFTHLVQATGLFEILTSNSGQNTLVRVRLGAGRGPIVPPQAPSSDIRDESEPAA